MKYAKEICTKYGFINKGHILGVGSFDELAAKKGADLKLQIRGMNIPDGLGFQYDKKGMYTRNISEDKDAGKIIKKTLLKIIKFLTKFNKN
ncbi:MAG: hypothetical protein E7059_03140 [Treponema bryantii]|nr:hypothetical protein [Treponema bryantii]